MLGVAIVKGTARVSIPIVLAVNYSALYSFLNLIEAGGERKFKTSLMYPHYDDQLRKQLSFLLYLLYLPPYLSTQDAVNHDNDETLQRVEHSKEDLEERRAAVSDCQHG